MTPFQNIIVGVLACMLLGFTPSLQAQATKTMTMQDVYNQAVKDFDAGKLDAAEKGFEKVLKANPRYVYARKYLVSIKQKRRTGDTSTTTIEPQVQKIIFASVEFDEASLKDVLTYLTQKAEKQTGGKFVPNFVYRGSTEQKSQPVTLKLRNVPMTDVIRYIGQTTNTRFTYDKYAIIGTPNTTTTTAPKATLNAEGAGTAKPSITNTFD